MESSLQDILLSHHQAYPEMELTDYIKLIYQNEFGCGHMVADLSGSEAFLKSEYETVWEPNPSLIEPIGNGLCRIHLKPDELAPGFLPVLNRLFAATANAHQGSMPEFHKKTTLLCEMAAQGRLPLKAEAVRRCLDEYFAAGCPPLHHSETYRTKYHPHYRVINMSYAFYLPVFQALQRLGESGQPAVIAIDGRCGSGKSMLAGILPQAFPCNVFHMDDFFLPLSMRTRERLSQPGGNVDYERFQKEVMEPLREGRDVSFQPFDCSMGELMPPVYRPAGALAIVEGSYSLHPAFMNRYDFRIFLTCSPEMQRQRLLGREGPQLLERFLHEWIPLEEAYFKAFDVARQCELVLDTTDFY